MGFWDITIYVAVTALLLQREMRFASAHVASTCYAIPNSQVIYTRDTGYTDDFYVWVSSYHQQGTGCYDSYYYKYYTEQRLAVTLADGTPVRRQKGDTEDPEDGTCLASTISSFSGTYTNTKSRSGTSSPTIKYDGACYDTYGSIYLGQGDSYLKRDHCSGGQGFTGLWFELDPIRLYASDKTDQSVQTKNVVKIKGWGCEGRWLSGSQWFDKEYLVQYGCPKGTWEDTSTKWSDTSSSSYCKACPPGYYSTHPKGADGKVKIQKGNTGEQACTPCAKGKFGDENQFPNRDTAQYCQKCPAGRYGDQIAMSDSQCSGECKKGFYCPSSELNTRPYGGSGGDPKEIKEGYYGSAGSSTETPHPCPAGYFCPKGSGNTDCVDPAVMWTSTYPQMDSRCKFLCGQGPNCKEDLSTKASTCYCPHKSISPKLVSPGYFASGSGNDDKPVMTRDSQTACNPPNFCLGGSCTDELCDGWYHPCPAGRYGSITGIKHPGPLPSGHADSALQCMPCQAGYRCQVGSNKATATVCGQDKSPPEKFYCPEGTGNTPKTVSDGKITVCPPTSPNGANCATNVREAEADCPSGYFCVNGTATSVKWQDASGKGICKITNQLDPKEGSGSGQVPEKAVGYKVMGRSSSGVWVAEGFDVRARNIAGNPVTSSEIVLHSEKCTQGSLKGTATSHFNLTATSTGAYVTSKVSLSTATCFQYQIIINASDTNKITTTGANPRAQCSLVIEVTNVNDSPSFNPPGMVDRAIYERSSVGTRASRVGVLGSDGKYKIGDIVTAAIATDPDVGQDIFYELKMAEPASSMNTFGVSKCSGEVFVKKSIPILNYIDHTVHFLCISACDDPSFFGDRVNESLYKQRCAPSPTYSGSEVNSTCGTSKFKDDCVSKNGYCQPIRIIDVNDRPEFNYTAAKCTGPDNPCYVDEQSKYGKVIANIQDQASDVDKDILRWSVQCLSCPTASVTSILRTNPALVRTSQHNFKSDDYVSFGDVSGMVEVNSDNRFVKFSTKHSSFKIKVVDTQSFELEGFDATNLPSGAVGSSGTVTLAPFEIVNGEFTTNLPSEHLTYLSGSSYSLEVSVQDSEFTITKMFQIKLRDVNDKPIFPSVLPTLSIDENALGNINGVFYATDTDDVPPNANNLTYQSNTNGITVDPRACTNGVCPCQLNVTVALDYEQSSSKIVSVTVFDKGLPASSPCEDPCKLPLNVTGQVVIVINDVNEPPSVKSQIASSVPETPVRKVSGSSSEPEKEVWEIDSTKTGTFQGDIIVNSSDYNYVDPEGSTVKRFEFNGGSYSCFSIEPFTGVIRLKQGKFLDFSSDSTTNVGCNGNSNSITFTVKVQDDQERQTPVTTTITVTVTEVDEVPYFTEVLTQNPYVATLNETTTDTLRYSGTVQNLTAITRDPENRPLTFQLIDGFTYSGELTSNKTTPTPITQFVLQDGGILKVGSGSNLNYEKFKTYRIQFMAIDQQINNVTSAVIIQLNDVNDPPVLNSTTIENNRSTWLRLLQHSQPQSCSASDAIGCKGGSEATKVGQIFIPDNTEKDEDTLEANYKFAYEIVSQKYESNKEAITSWSQSFNHFEIDPTTGVITVNKSCTSTDCIPSELRSNTSAFRLEVRIRNNQAIEQKTSASNVYVYIEVIDVDTPPIIWNLPKAISISEITNAATEIFRVNATDEDSTVTFLPISVVLPRPGVKTDTKFYTNGKKVGESNSGMGDSTKLILPPNVPFSVDSATGAIRLTSSGIDFERGGFNWDRNATVEIKVTDGNSVRTSYLYVNVQDVNEAPVFKVTDRPYKSTVWENSISTLLIKANNQANTFIALDVDDADNSGTTTKEWGDTNSNRPKCRNDKCSYGVTAIEFKKNGISVTSPATVRASNTLRVSDYDQSHFGRGHEEVNLTLAGKLNFEELDTVIFTIRVVDSAQNSVSTTVTVEVKDKNEEPSLHLGQPFSVREDFATNAALGLDFSANTTDPDSVTNFNYTIDYEKCVYNATADTNTNIFRIDQGQTTLKLGSTALDFENCENYRLSIKVHDQGNGVAGQPSLTATAILAVNVKDVNDVSSASTNGTSYNRLQTTGSEALVITGSNFGPTKNKRDRKVLSKAVPTVRYGPDKDNLLYSAIDCFVDDAIGLGNEVIKCKTAPGVGKNHKLLVTIAGTSGPVSSDQISYEAPSITSAPGFNSIATGTPERIYISGSNFGDGQSAVSVRYTNNNGDAFVATGCTPSNHNRLACYSSIGSGTGLQWTVTVGHQTSDLFPVNPLTNVSSYRKSTISAIYVDNALVSGNSPRLNGVGGQNLELIGSFFGPTVSINANVIRLQYGRNDNQAIKYEVGCSASNHSRLLCTSVAGVGTDHILRAVINGLVGEWTSSLSLSYKEPIVSEVSGPGALESRTEGGATVNIYGSNFGPRFTNIRALPCGILTTPIYTPQEFIARQYADLQVQYGPISDSKYRGQCCVIHSDKHMECTTDAGVGKGHAWKVNIGGQVSNLFKANTSYGPPVVRDYEEVYVNIQRFKTQGGDFVDITGKNYGPDIGGVNNITYGQGKGLEFEVDINTCTMISQHERIRCKMSPGAGKKLNWVLTIGHQKSVYPSTAYGPPEVRNVTTSSGSQIMKQKGGEWIYIDGTNFGPLGYKVSVTYGKAGLYYEGLECEIIQNSIRIRCKSSPGIGGPHHWHVSVRGQTSAKNTAAIALTSYEVPQLFDVKPTSSPTSGVTGVVVEGKGFGSFAKDGTINQVQVLFDGVVLPNNNRPIVRNAPTTGKNASLEFAIGEGFNNGHSISIRLTSPDGETVLSSNSLEFNYDDPEVSTVRVENFVGAVGDERRLTITGKNFCANSQCGTLLVNNKSVPVISYTHTEIIAITSVNGGWVQVRVGTGSKEKYSKPPEKFAELAPVLSEANKTALAQMRGFTTEPNDNLLWISGAELGTDKSQLCVSVGWCPQRKNPVPPGCEYNKLCDNANKSAGRTANITHVVKEGGKIITVAFFLPQGAGRNQEVIIWKGNQPSVKTIQLFLHFDPPSIENNQIQSSSGVFKSLDTNGVDQLLTIKGTNFGDKYVGKLLFGLGPMEGAGARRLLSAKQRRRKLLSGTQSTVCVNSGEIFCSSENVCKSAGNVCAVDLNEAGQVQSWNHNTIVFKLPPGQGTKVYLNLKVGNQGNDGDKYIYLSYNSPTITSVHLASGMGASSGPTTGQTVLKVIGSNFGCPKTPNTLCQGGQSARLFSGLPDTHAYNCQVHLAGVNHSSLLCTTSEGEGENLYMEVNVSGRTTPRKENAFSYLRPSISILSRDTSPTSALEDKGNGAQKILVTAQGANFGPADRFSNTQIVVDCKNPDGNGPSKHCRHGRLTVLNHTMSGWKKNHTHLSFHVPEGYGQVLQLKVIVGGSPSNEVAFSYLDPSISAVSPLTGPTDGCGADQWEDLQAWRVRVDGASPDEKRLNPQKYARRCKKWTTIKIDGENFGPSARNVQVWIGECSDFKTKEGCDMISDDVCSWSGKCSKAPAATTGELRKTMGAFIAFDGVSNPVKGTVNCNDPQSRKETCLCQSSFSHNSITFCSPEGFGRNLSVVLSVYGNEIQSAKKYDFFRPKIMSSQPRPYDARGESINIRGSDFGGKESLASVYLHGRSCKNSKWIKAHEEDGLPYISCEAPGTVVGPKNVSLRVALQTSETAVALRSISNSFAYSICKMGDTRENGLTDIYWGRPGEVCTICKAGAVCKPNSMLAPYSATGFWRENLDISEGTSEGRVDDLMSKKADDDYSRAQTRCPPERLLSDTIKKNYPNAKQRDKCYDFVSCIPQEACLGKNRCEKEYLHQELNCGVYDAKIRASAGNNAKSSPLISCEVDLQCRVRSGGASCVKAIKDVCQCGPQWENIYDGLPCLKSCIRNAAKSSLLVAACGSLKGRQVDVLSNLQAVMARAECGFENPEDCSYCVRYDNSSTGESYGECKCSPGYRCSLCTSGTHYRIDNKCEECPKSPELIIALFIFGIVVAVVGLYELDKRRFNLAFVNIGWDYFQVLSMFTDADVRWPAALKALYRFFSLFSFDIDIVAPECLVPNFPYQLKWWMTILSPLACAFVLVLVLVFSILHMICWKGISWSSRDKTMSARLFTAPFLMMLYFLYVTVTRRAFDIFNCNPLPGDAYDGFLYTSFTSYECDSGPCRCDDPRHIQVGLKLPAAVTIIIMTIGFPACLFILLRAKKYTIKMDQLLRAADVGDTLESSANAEAYQTRLAYHKMYYHFLPGKTYWITYIIIRKGAIAAAALTFRANPGFQLAFVLLILFVAYVLQVKHRPYMSTAARDQALADHAEKVEMGDEDHILIASKIKKAREFKKTKEKRNQVRKKGFQLGAAKKHDGRNKARKKQHVYFWDYNTVEQVLLACAILVALAGVMFESDRFANDKTNAFAWQREAITYIIMFIVVFSLLYYFVVFFSELYGKIPDWATRLAGRLRKSGLTSHGSESISKADLSFFNNPLMAGDAVKLQKHKEDADKAVADRDKQLREQHEQNRMLLQRLRDAKKNQGQGAFGKKNPLANKRKGKGNKNKKKQFTPQRMRDDSDVIEMAPIRNKGKV